MIGWKDKRMNEGAVARCKMMMDDIVRKMPDKPVSGDLPPKQEEIT